MGESSRNPDLCKPRATHSPGISRTRLAPSPTGALHLGNIRTFLVNAALAHKHDMRVLMRIEDIDSPRIKEGAIDQTLETLEWIGLWWDEGPIVQSHDFSPYESAVAQLARGARAYPCDMSRKEIAEALSAPHERESEPARNESVYPAHLRPELVPRPFDDRETNWRFAVADETVEFVDDFAGARAVVPARSVGDFPIWTKRGVPSYQLAVVVDDARQGVTHVVRGDDLLDSTARQIMLGRALGLEPIASYTHLPLVLGTDGRRLAKRHGDTRLLRYREEGVTPERVIGLLAFWSGVKSERAPMDIAEFIDRFDLARMDPSPTIFTEEDESWLTRRA